MVNKTTTPSLCVARVGAVAWFSQVNTAAQVVALKISSSSFETQRVPELECQIPLFETIWSRLRIKNVISMLLESIGSLIVMQRNRMTCST